MIRWEVKRVSRWHIGIALKTPLRLEKELTKLGDEGWELVAFEEQVVWLKRKVSEMIPTCEHL